MGDRTQLGPQALTVHALSGGAGGVAELSAGLALPGAHLQLRGHQPAAAVESKRYQTMEERIWRKIMKNVYENRETSSHRGWRAGWGTEEVPGLNSPQARKTGGRVQGFGLGRCPLGGSPVLRHASNTAVDGFPLGDLQCPH